MTCAYAESFPEGSKSLPPEVADGKTYGTPLSSAAGLSWIRGSVANDPAAYRGVLTWARREETGQVGLLKHVLRIDEMPQRRFDPSAQDAGQWVMVFDDQPLQRVLVTGGGSDFGASSSRADEGVQGRLPTS